MSVVNPSPALGTGPVPFPNFGTAHVPTPARRQCPPTNANFRDARGKVAPMEVPKRRAVNGRFVSISKIKGI